MEVYAIPTTKYEKLITNSAEFLEYANMLKMKEQFNEQCTKTESVHKGLNHGRGTNTSS